MIQRIASYLAHLTTVSVLCSSLLFSTHAVATPYTFTQQDYIEYGIYFSAGYRKRAEKLLTIRFGDINGYYAEYFPQIRDVPTQKQTLRLRTSRGSVIVNRNDNEGLTVTRDTYNERKRTGTKRLDVNFQNATCTDAIGASLPCNATLVLTTDGPDQGASTARRNLTITTSTGLSFSYRTRRRLAGRPYTPADFRAPVVNNYAWEWRPGIKD